MNLNSYKTLGVINRTPNSFSDHGLSLNQTHFENQLQSFLDDPSIIIDIGFESTAPMNTAISLDEEKDRFNEFLKASKKFSFKDKIISFDTYKIQNFLYMATEFNKLHENKGIIFNDVSGVLNDELKELLIKYKSQEFFYIYTFSHIPERSLVLDHMKFLDESKDIIEQTTNAFKLAFEWFKRFGMENQLILDPGFGFSKTFEQNWSLINEFGRLSDNLIDLKISNPILIGLSKKSFLKKALVPDSSESIETLHQKCIDKISSSSKSKLLFRVHEPQNLNIPKIQILS